MRQKNADSVKELLPELYENGGDYSADWYVISLYRLGYDCRDNAVIKALKSTVNGFYSYGLERTKVTDLQRSALALIACGEDVTDIDGHNLLADATYNRPKYRPLNAQGVNSLSYALILLDSMHFPIPDNALESRSSILKNILGYEAKNGGFSLTGGAVADTDITAITIQALAPYRYRDDVDAAVDRAVAVLAKRMNDDGEYKNFYGDLTSETAAQVILALTSLEIDPQTDSRFNRNGNPVTGLMDMQLKSGAFPHVKGGSENEIATYQSFEAMAALQNLMNGGDSFFEFGYYKTRYSVPTETETDDVKNVEKSKKRTSHQSSDTVSQPRTDDKTVSSDIVSESKKSTQKTNKSSKKKTKASPEKPSLKEKTESPKTPAKSGIKTDKGKRTHLSDSSLASPAKSSVDYITFSAMLSGYALLYIIKLGRNKK